ncbi:MAG TPA: hypothetical protein VL485_12740 [Ktedonobacteraceae bacterium]|nr:hypothetical protein [Ktedonobacteraceae bacterium]
MRYQLEIKKLPPSLQYLTSRLLERINDPAPESLSTQTTSTFTCGWFPTIALSGTIGLFSIAYAFILARDGKPGLEIFFLLGLLFVFAPPLVRLLSAIPSRFECIAIVCSTSLVLYIIKIQCSPSYFSFFDEFLHWHTANDILKTGHLYTSNTLLPVSPYYPGLEMVTNAFSTLSDLNIFYSAIIVIGVARLVMVLSLYLLNEHLLSSSRMAGIASIIYMGNPHFLIFDAQYGYESLALPLMTFVLFTLTPHQAITARLNSLGSSPLQKRFTRARRTLLRGDLHRITIIALLVLGAVVVTHHVTDFFFDGILILWAISSICLRFTPLHRSYLARIAVVGVALSVLVALQAGNPVVGYISSFIGIALNELGHIVTGTGSAKPLFQSYNGHPTGAWERILTSTSQLLVLSGLPLGLLCLWPRFRGNALLCTFGVLAFCYPLVQVFRFTTSGSELVDRSAAFLFIPISTILSIAIAQLWPLRQITRLHISSITAALSVMMIGSIVLATGSDLSVLPGPYMVIADARSIEAEGIQVATWTHTYLGPNNRIATDRINQVLMGTYGDQQIVTNIADHIDIAPIFLSPQLGPDQTWIITHAHVRYLVADMRLTRSLPLLGFYYEQDEQGAYKHREPINPEDLTKFATVPQINKIFDSGDIVIYDAEGVINASEKS